MRNFLVLALVALSLAAARAGQPKESMCVKQKDGTYKCLASGQTEEESCCQTPANEASPTPRPKK